MLVRHCGFYFILFGSDVKWKRNRKYRPLKKIKIKNKIKQINHKEHFIRFP